MAGAEPSFAEALADGLAAELAAELSSTLTAWSEGSSAAGSASPPPLRGDLPSDAVTVRNLSDQSLSAGRVSHAHTDLTLLDELTSGDVLLGAGRLDEARAAYRSALRTARGAGHPLPALHAMVGLASVAAGREDLVEMTAWSERVLADAQGTPWAASPRLHSRPRLRRVGGLQRPRRRRPRVNATGSRWSC